MAALAACVVAPILCKSCCSVCVEAALLVSAQFTVYLLSQLISALFDAGIATYIQPHACLVEMHKHV